MTFTAFTVIHPGDGKGCAEDARDNLVKFVADLGLSDPGVEVDPWEGTGPGGYRFRLYRGTRAVRFDGLREYRVVLVEMPGVPCDSHRFGRLYLDGDSFTWDVALEVARCRLADPYRVVERRVEASHAACVAQLAATRRCSTCATALVMGQPLKPRISSLAWEDPGDYAVRCLACDPLLFVQHETGGGAVYAEDTKEYEQVAHYAVTYQHLPPETPGDADVRHPDALCGAQVEIDRDPDGPRRAGMGREICRLQRGHRERCEGYVKMIRREYVDPDPYPWYLYRGRGPESERGPK